MSESLRDVEEALKYAQQQHASATQDWTGFCQKFVRSCYGIGPLFGSAWLQWLGADPEDRHVGGSPDDAPLGSALCYKGSGVFGHIDLAARAFKNDTSAAWSNDLVRWGDIDKVARTAPTSAWGQTYLGYLTAVNDVDLRLHEKKPPKPKQDKPYKSVERAIEKMQTALHTAIVQKDAADQKVFRAEIARLKKMHGRLRHA